MSKRKKSLKEHRANPPKRVAILAQGTSLLDYVHFSMMKGGPLAEVDEVWAINATGGTFKHDLLFHMDDCKVQEMRAEAGNANMQGMVDWLKQDPNFFTSKVYPEYKGARAFPLEDVVNDLKTIYLNGTCAYAIAYAIHIGVKEMLLFGMDYYAESIQNKTAYFESGRSCVEYLLGIACDRRIMVHIAPSSRLLDTHVPDEHKPYGYDAFNVKLGKNKKGKWKIEYEDKPLPTAEEMEKRYGHKLKGN